MKQLNISMRASICYSQSPYRRIIQKEMKRIAPIDPFVKGKFGNNFKLSGTVSSFIHTYIYI